MPVYRQMAGRIVTMVMVTFKVTPSSFKKKTVLKFFSCTMHFYKSKKVIRMPCHTP